MDTGRIGELQRIAQVQTLRTLQQTVVTPLPAGSGQGSQSQLGQGAPRGTPIPAGRAAVDVARETTVELSAAAQLPPVLGHAAIEAIRDTSATALATVLVDLTRALHDPSAGPDETPAPALRLATQLRMLTEVIATATDPVVTSPISTAIPTQRARSAYQRMAQAVAQDGFTDGVLQAAPDDRSTALDPRITQVMVAAQAHAMAGDSRATGVLPHGAAAYLAAPGLSPTFARMDLIEVEPDDGRNQDAPSPSTMLATLHLQLGDLGQLTATVALTGARAAVSIAGNARAVSALRESEPAVRDAAAAWGVRLGLVNFVEFS